MKYVSTQPITLSEGSVLGLTPAQAAPRRHALKPSGKKGVYTTTQPVQFKAGESFYYEGDIPKGMADAVMTAADKAKAEAAEREAADLDEAKSKAQKSWDADEVLRKQYGDKFEDYLADVLKAG
jgi:hypothetical protein